MSNGEIYSVGNSDFNCVYDAALLLGLIMDGICLDRNSEFYRVLLCLFLSACDALPDTLTLKFGKAE